MPHTVFATFQVAAGREAELGQLLDVHWQLIQERGYAEGPEPVRLLRAQSSGPVLLELFDCKEGGVGRAAADEAVRAL